MPTIEASRWCRAPLTPCALAVVVIGLCCGGARAEPPIRSPEDAACRLEARARVFVTPNPRGLEMEEHGKNLYYACMRRLDAAARPVKPQRRRHHGHRRR